MKASPLVLALILFAQSLILMGATVSGTGGGVSGWPSNSANKAITWATSEANCARIGSDTSYFCIYHDLSEGLVWKPYPLGNTLIYAWTNFNACIYDAEGASTVLCFNPDAATPKEKYPFTSGYYPLKSIWIGAGGLDGDGTQCPALATTVTINSGPKIPTFICTDNNSSILYGAVHMPDAWDGGTITFTHSYIQTAADTGVLNGDVAAQCRGTGETVSSTWGSEVAIDDAAVSGSNINDMTTSAAVTPAGTCAGGDMLYFYYALDTATTTAVATLHHVGFKIEYSVTSLSD